jgi:DNA-binding LacI/PurR family transcriptional regulator
MAAGKNKRERRADGAVTLKSVAEHVGFSPGTISAVLNNAPSAKHIPQPTRTRILNAARELNYKPNFFARSLRKKRTCTLGVIVHDIGEGYGSLVVAGIESYVRERDYFFVIGVHRHDPIVFEKYAMLLLQRGVEGFITVDLDLPHALPLPTVAVSGHGQHEGATNIVVDHRRAAELALQHLVELGHREIAVMIGDVSSPDAAPRWEAISQVARELGVAIRPELTVQIESQESTPKLGYPFAMELLARKQRFTALFAYNDISAIGAVRALQESGLRVPDDISVIGFDDIPGAAFHYPSVTTIRQPLRRMGEIAAETLVQRIEGREDYPAEIAVAPELIVRESTGQAANGSHS